MTNKATMIAFPEQKVTKNFISTKSYKFCALNSYISFTHTEVFITHNSLIQDIIVRLFCFQSIENEIEKL